MTYNEAPPKGLMFGGIGELEYWKNNKRLPGFSGTKPV